MKREWEVAVYCRLSQEDKEFVRESSSINNQKSILTEYVAKQGWKLAEIYVDDGFSGTNYNRPGFKRMIVDAEKGKFNCVITKDLSRLGRNYSETGYYIDDFFPGHRIRYIALNDNVDSESNENDYVGFANVINEFYPRDISKKVRQVRRINAEKGNFMGSRAPYGYIKSPEDKHKLIVDEETEEIVRYIFTLYANGQNGREIADVLNKRHTPSPSMILRERTGKNYTCSEFWSSTSIYNIVKNQVYIGNMVQGKRVNISFKSKQRRVADEDEWIVVKNTHEPIVTVETWNRCNISHEKIASHRKPKAGGEVAMFSGLLVCADCDSPLSASRRGTSKKLSYRCNNYVNKGKMACSSSHNIQEQVLSDIVLNDIRKYAKRIKLDIDGISNRIISALKINDIATKNINIKRKSELQNKLDSTLKIVKSLYAEKALGQITADIYNTLVAEYLNDKFVLEKEINELEIKISHNSIEETKIERWMSEVKKHTSLKELNRDLVVQLISKIVVGPLIVNDNGKEQELTIYYNIVGNLNSITKKETSQLSDVS